MTGASQEDRVRGERPSSSRASLDGTILSVLAEIMLTACATTTTETRDLGSATSRSCKLRAAIAYDGNPEFLPDVLISDSNATKEVY